MTDKDILNDNPEEQDLLLRLAALPQEAEPARDLWPGIAARIAMSENEAPAGPVLVRPLRRRRFLIQAAAALLLFTCGVAVGHRWGTEPAAALSSPQSSRSLQSPRSVHPQRDPLAPAVEVQRTGTEYVAALRRLAEGPGSPVARDQGREAALSALYGAAHELVRLDPDNPGVTQILKTVTTTRSSTVRRAVRF
jgi:hypothetical protein